MKESRFTQTGLREIYHGAVFKTGAN